MPTPENQRLYLQLAKKEHWDIEVDEESAEDGDAEYRVIAEGTRFPLVHPYIIHLSLYREAASAGERFSHIKAAHDYLWPEFAKTWNDWDEMRFWAHCEKWRQIVLAGPASSAKSHCVARIGSLFWLSDPKHNAVLVASTTLESLEKRIWGYVARFIQETAVPVPASTLTGKPPKIMHVDMRASKIHGMFAEAIRQGEETKVLSTVIGRHPDKCFMVILDEATDMNNYISKAIPNWEKGVEFFQMWAIGNSNSRNDLHGALATPKNGWKSVDPMRDKIWPTVHDGGVCLYFNPYNSPAIHDPDPVKRAVLGMFLPTQESIERDKERYGERSDSFWRFVMGFWKTTSTDRVVVSNQFLDESQVWAKPEWSGFFPLMLVGGLDAAFTTAKTGAGCVLRLGVLGVTTSGDVVLDFRDTELLFKIDIDVTGEDKSGELQLARGVLGKLQEYQCPLANVAIDISGCGRALPGLLQVMSRQINWEQQMPLKICSSPNAREFGAKKDDPTVLTASPTVLWFQFRKFVEHRQIFGMDFLTGAQISNRLVDIKNGKPVIESKDEYQARMSVINPRLAHTPDEADAAILCVHAAMLRYGWFPGMRKTPPSTESRSEMWLEKMRAMSLVPGTPWSDGARSESKERPKLIPNFSGSLEDAVRFSYTRDD